MKAKLFNIAFTATVLTITTNLGAVGPSELKTKATAVRATTGEMNFKKIPWVTDLLEGFELAKKENRPVFFYLQTGDPLDDC